MFQSVVLVRQDPADILLAGPLRGLWVELNNFKFKFGASTR